MSGTLHYTLDLIVQNTHFGGASPTWKAVWLRASNENSLQSIQSSIFLLLQRRRQLDETSFSQSWCHRLVGIGG